MSATKQLIASLNTRWHEYFSERAGILEFDGKLPSQEAEERAFRETMGEMLKVKIMEISRKPRPVNIPKHRPVMTGKELAAGVES